MLGEQQRDHQHLRSADSNWQSARPGMGSGPSTHRPAGFQWTQEQIREEGRELGARQDPARLAPSPTQLPTSAAPHFVPAAPPGLPPPARPPPPGTSSPPSSGWACSSAPGAAPASRSRSPGSAVASSRLSLGKGRGLGVAKAGRSQVQGPDLPGPKRQRLLPLLLLLFLRLPSTQLPLRFGILSSGSLSSVWGAPV